MHSAHADQNPHTSNEPSSLSRRSLLAFGGLAAAGATVGTFGATPAVASPTRQFATDPDRMAAALAELEHAASVTIGVVAVAHGSPNAFRYRAADRFPMCSLFKPLAAAALVQARGYDDAYWNTPIRYAEADVVSDSLVLDSKRPREATPGELADAALRRSDNTAGNLLLRELGGPAAITAFAASLGATDTRLDRWEPELNEALPGDPRDTTTPDDIARLYTALLLDDAAGVLASSRLREWMLRNRTSDARMRAGLTPPYELADKTGGGAYGVVNDAGVLWRAGEPPVTVVIMTRTDRADAVRNNAVVADATRIVVGG